MDDEDLEAVLVVVVGAILLSVVGLAVLLVALVSRW